ncbi:hypothetical protein [Effusibacillus lacus]|uniref:hypothetical protein n=1 Tax=Effusibacillus lacus TaxID=1348429 RepID=UPI000BB82105
MHEQDIESLLKEAKNKIVFTTDTIQAVEQAEIILIAIGTPPKPNGNAYTRYCDSKCKKRIG